MSGTNVKLAFIIIFYYGKFRKIYIILYSIPCSLRVRVGGYKSYKIIDDKLYHGL